MNCCQVYPTTENEGCPLFFSCAANGSFAECSFSGGYKNRCPRKNGMDCTSLDARLAAGERAKKEMTSIIKTLKAKKALRGDV
jgi:hypothetical protein